MQINDYIFLIYLFIASIVAVAATIHDKNAAGRGKWRVPERTLMTLGTLSGCAAMYCCMKLIHHKTRKPKFMVGLPVIFFLELAAVTALRLYLAGIIHF